MGRIELPSMVYETIALPLSYIGIIKSLASEILKIKQQVILFLCEHAIKFAEHCVLFGYDAEPALLA